MKEANTIGQMIEEQNGKEVKTENPEVECRKVVEDALKRYDCYLGVDFSKDIVLGNIVLLYNVTISKKVKT